MGTNRHAPIILAQSGISHLSLDAALSKAAFRLFLQLEQCFKFSIRHLLQLSRRGGLLEHSVMKPIKPVIIYIVWQEEMASQHKLHDYFRGKHASLRDSSPVWPAAVTAARRGSAAGTHHWSCPSPALPVSTGPQTCHTHRNTQPLKVIFVANSQANRKLKMYSNALNSNKQKKKKKGWKRSEALDDQLFSYSQECHWRFMKGGWAFSRGISS